ncbi:MAG TPA: hypothetical protein VIJ92_17560 [Ginsengibacter sp.]
MKILTIIFLLTLSFSLVAQHKIVGHYRDYFGDRIQLNADSTFEYTWHFDLSASWTKGTWSLKKDTLYFQMLPIYDTISYKNNDGTSADKLILSLNDTSERLTPEQYAGMGLPSGGQNFQSYPDKLFFKKGRLYKTYNGRLFVKKQKGFWTKKKWSPWFFKSDD